MPLDESAAPPATPLRRVVVASFIGTMIEWYDYFLYGTAAALVFDKVFFPKLDPFAGAMASFATFTVGFVARPIGGIVFGHFGDRIGRKSMLVTSLMLMGTATFLIGLLPTYDQIGIAAPVLLVVLRFIQGFGVGGEWGGAVLMVVEHAHRSRRGLYASFVQAGVPAGSLLANAVFNLVSYLTKKSDQLDPSVVPGDAFLSWGWRIPFLLGLVLLGIGLFIRLQILESPLFTNLRERKQQAGVPFFEVIKNYPRNVLLAIGARFAENGSYYVFTVFLLLYATDPKYLDLPRTTILNCQLIASAIQLFVIPVCGRISDEVGRRPVYLGGAVALALFAFPFFWMVNTANTLWIVVALTLAQMFTSAMYAPQAAFFAELFGTNVRYTGASIGSQLASPLAGLAPLISMALLQWAHGKTWPVAIYIIVLATITIVSVWLAAETHRRDLGDHGHQS